MSPPVTSTRRDFDSDLLGLDTWALSLAPDASDADLVSGVADAAARVADLAPSLASARLPEGFTAGRRALEASGFTPVEVLVTLRAPTPGSDAPDRRARLATPADVAACVDIARAAFSFDRYHADPGVADERADDLKATWVANDLGGRADASFVVDDGERVAGFNLCLRSGDDAVIDLIAVAPGHQGRGLGGALVTAARHHYADADGMVVGTQATNHASLALYRRRGFVEQHRQVTYHLVSR